jgi:hypothetical protein
MLLHDAARNSLDMVVVFASAKLLAEIRNGSTSLARSANVGRDLTGPSILGWIAPNDVQSAWPIWARCFCYSKSASK